MSRVVEYSVVSHHESNHETTSGESVLRMGAGIPTVSRLQTLAWIWFAMDFFAAAKGFLRWMVPNDLLPFEVVAVLRPIVVTSRSGPHRLGTVC